MFSIRSLIGLLLSLLLHGGIVAYVVTHNVKKETSKPEKISMQLAMFKIAAPTPKPVASPPSPIISPKKQIEKTVVRKSEAKSIKTLKPVKQPKQKPIIEKIAITKPQPKARTNSKSIIKKKTSKPKKKTVTKKVTTKKKTVKKKPTPRKPRPIHKKIATKDLQQQRVRALAQQKSRALAQKRIQEQARARAQAITQAKQKAKIVLIKKPKETKKPTPQINSANTAQLEKQYGNGVRQKIERGKKYPRRAKRKRKQGVVKVGFTLNRNGLISNLRVVKSSGTKALDASALQAVKKVGHFPFFPAGLNKQVIHYVVPISFSLR